MRTIRVALPKGRLGEKSYAVLARAGYPCPEMEEENRRLIFDNISLAILAGLTVGGFFIGEKPTPVVAPEAAPAENQ